MKTIPHKKQELIRLTLRRHRSQKETLASHFSSVTPAVK